MWKEVNNIDESILWDYLDKKTKEPLGLIREWLGVFEMPLVGKTKEGRPKYELRDVLRIFGVPYKGNYYRFHVWMRSKKIEKIEIEYKKEEDD
jgi:hypothetical protein